MSKPPPTDIVMEVARAADPQRAAAVANRLNALAAHGAGSAQDFASALNEVQRPAPAPASRPSKAERQFESVVLSQFIGEMLPKDAPSAFGEGFAGDMWRSMLAERVADQIAASGRLGIAHRLFAHQAGEAHALLTSANPLSSASGAHIENGAAAFAKAKTA